MRILLTGHRGYIGAVITPMLQAAGYEVVGLDSDLYSGCDFTDVPAEVAGLNTDLRDVRIEDLEGIDAVVHLAGLSNDPTGDLDPHCTHEINYLASVRLAEMARDAGVKRFVFASSCSIYGAAGPEDILDEDAPLRPVSAYGHSKARVEAELSRLAGGDFSPVYLRNATAYGVSPRLRMDVVVNYLVGAAFATGEVLLKSDGTPWRPLVHVEDIGRAVLAVLKAPRSVIHNQAFNVGRDEDNRQIREIAEAVRRTVPGSEIRYAPEAGPDRRCYRVNFTKIRRLLPAYQPEWTLQRGIEQLYEAYVAEGLSAVDLEGPRYVRLKRIRQLLGMGVIDSTLRWRVVNPSAA